MISIINLKEELPNFINNLDLTIYGKNPNTTMNIVNAIISEFDKYPKLFNCTIESIKECIKTCIFFGLMPGSVLGHIYFIPYNSGQNIITCKIIFGYKGILDILYRNDIVESVDSHIVYEDDIFDVSLGTEISIIHKPNIKSTSFNIVASYVILHLNNKKKIIEILLKKELVAIKEKAFISNAWKDFEGEMMRKTCLRRAIKRCYFSPNHINFFSKLFELDNDNYIYNDKEKLTSKELINQRIIDIKGD
jgi:phage RecT family recombinase